MSKAHNGSRLLLNDQIMPTEYNTFHMNCNVDASAIYRGYLILPEESTYTLQHGEGVFGGNAIAIEEATENLLTDPMNPDSWYKYADPEYGFISQEIIETEFGVKGLRRTITSSDYRSSLVRLDWDYTKLDINKTYTFSIYARSSTPSVNTRIHFNLQSKDAEENRVDQSKYVYIDNVDWKRFEWSFTPVDSATASFISYFKIYTQSTDGVERTIEVVMPQIEEKPFVTSFVNGFREEGKLIFTPSFIRDINHFTLNFWAKSLFEDQPNGFYINIEIDENNRVFFRPDTDRDTIDGGRVVDAESNDIGKVNLPSLLDWHMYTLQSDGDKMRIFIDGELQIEKESLPELHGQPTNLGFVQRVDGLENCNFLLDELRIDNQVVEEEIIKAWYLSQSYFYNAHDYRAHAY
ncbi:phage head spike fiber domain-containing protein [Chengkuizengella axinellae]|uniref:Carbohydrate binding domain-containing protein n=1 Tax=Chengkuizengella axinellae TaxID=3064388 RepID=A0ABT9IWD4_9BACL|nr:carbohydrate binding domain-containing protein [Chengkuizengella sp. 2205SS18-9]MDP5273661.1 carbohydrate binding domain-containing protein [Chengkuizengella sp. 2205SS18-9]